MTKDTPTSTQSAMAMAIDAARQVGLDTKGATLLRAASSTMVLLPNADAVARFEPPEPAGVALRQVRAARFLADRAVPSVRLLDPEAEPHTLPGGTVTFWERLDILPHKPTTEDLGRFARDLHDATRGHLPPDMPALDPFEIIRASLARPAALSMVGTTGPLHDALDDLEKTWPTLTTDDPLGLGFVHGDFHTDNLAITPHGLVLMDLELSGQGPVSWDLAAQWVAVTRYGTPPEAYARFCDAYGWDLRLWPGSETLCQIYALVLASWAVGLSDTSPRMAQEADIRLSGFLGLADRPWTLL